MAVRIAHASINEYGSTKNGQQGDQNAKEVTIRNFYSKGWTYLPVSYTHLTLPTKA